MTVLKGVDNFMITFIKGSPCFNHVRVLKFIEYFNRKGSQINFWCWKRTRAEPSDPAENYLLTGGGYASKKLFFFYPVWCLLVFLKAIFKKYAAEDSFFVIDFDSALPIYLASLIRGKITYVYDIHDDFSMRYRFPVFINDLIRRIDSKIKNRALKVIHVDENRIRAGDDNFEIIYNTPMDIYSDYQLERPPLDSKKFAVTGLLSESRGLDSIYQLARNNSKFQFIVAGTFLNSEKLVQSFLNLSNVEYLGSIDQKVLFSKIADAGYIFSLYDPSVEINRRAASNKLYDAMMLGVPVITNNGLMAAELVKNENLGFVVNFNYDESWNVLVHNDSESMLKLSENCRKLYDLKFSYSNNFTNKLSNIYG
ncbi:MAG: glycosyltransferase [Paraglaciecola sp.]|nr:glycosyltransferase [Paraglaciecola sp.]